MIKIYDIGLCDKGLLVSYNFVGVGFLFIYLFLSSTLFLTLGIKKNKI